MFFIETTTLTSVKMSPMQMKKMTETKLPQRNMESLGSAASKCFFEIKQLILAELQDSITKCADNKSLNLNNPNDNSSNI